MKRFRIKLAVAALALFSGVALYISTVPRTEAIAGGLCTYYETAAKKKVVGQFGAGCCGEVIAWGTVTPYRTCGTVYCLDVWCPETQ